MKRFQEFITENLQVYEANWGFEVAGTSEECIAFIKKYPGWKCIVSLERPDYPEHPSQEDDVLK